MRDSTGQLAGVLSGGSFQVDVTADIFYDGDRRLQDVPISDWSFNGDLDAEIPTAGDLTIVYQDDFAESYTPREVTDSLAPFGSIAVPYVTITAGKFRERMQIGVFRIDDVPEARDEFLNHRGRQLVVGSVVQVSLQDLFRPVKKARFRSLEQPASLISAWAEIARITRLPVTRTVADAPIPKTITYDRDRLATVQTLAAVLGGTAVMLADGSVGIIPDTPGAAVAELKIGDDEGVLLDVGYSLGSDDIPNVVVGDFEDAQGREIHVEAEITEGPLSVDGPYGEVVVEYPTDRRQLIATREAAQAAVNAERDRLARGAAPLVPVDTLFDPRLELGDVITLQRPDRLLTARVRKWAMGGDSSGARDMSLSVEVTSDEPY